MAKRVQVLLEDDIDGGTANETVSFSLDGDHYEIDLNKRNAAKLRSMLEPYIKRARTAPARGRGSTSTAGERSAEIRAWARSQGIPVNERGRIATSLIDKYEAAAK